MVTDVSRYVDFVMLDHEDIDAIAAAVADRLNDRPQFVGVAELAHLWNVSPDLIYAKADQLGAIRLGARLIFDVNEAASRMRRQPTPADSHAGVRVGTPTNSRRKRRTSSAVELLPIKDGQR